MKKIICLLLALVMTVGMLGIFASCGDDVCENHVDSNLDGKCDECGAVVTTSCSHVDEDPKDEVCDKCGADMSEEVVINYPWDSQSLIFMMSENSNGEELPSGCHRYLAGDDPNATEVIDTNIDKRNNQAEYYTKTDVTYQYWPDNAEYGWGDSIEKIYTIVYSNTTNDVPDIYCNFVYDMVGASVRGCFANLKSTARGQGELAGLNYFEFLDDDYDEEEDNRGYMHEYMESVTLSKHKMYVLASDYFTDLIRAFFIIPISISLIESVGPTVTGERDGVDGWTVDDFYAQVWDMEWNYDLMMKYSAAVYQDDGDNATDAPWLGDTVGFGYSTKGVAACGLLFTTSVVLIEKQFNEELNDYEYFFPTTNEKLYAFVDAAKELLNSKGVVRVGNVTTGAYSIKKWGEDGLRAVRTRFSQNKVLFGDIMMIGALEYDAYQSMKNPDGTGGFGLVCVPLYTDAEGERYLTQIHNVGRPGAIGANTLKFAECTAFLNYQSTHSTDILDNYYNFKLMYDIAGGAEGTVDMLRYIRLNVRTSFDKAFEDALGVFHGKEAGYNNKLLVIVSNAAFDINIRAEYDRILELKNNQLNTLEEYYLTSPN